MVWPFDYHFIDLTPGEKQIRRQTLNEYGHFAQLSALVPVALILLYRFIRWASSHSGGPKGDYAAVPGSPVLKEKRNSGLGSWSSRLRKIQWWLGEDVVMFGEVLGQRDQWVIGLLWTAWLLVLSVLETGDDYLHLTKRLGIVAVSQWPLQYLLALKSLNPVAYLLRSSHEQVNRLHRVMARVTTTLLCLHTTLYLAFFVKRDRLDRLGNPVVFAGVVSFIGLMVLISTALRPVRRFSYRLFFIFHLVLGILIPILLLIHAAPARIYLFECLGVFFLDLASRKMDTVTGNATVESIPGTDLVKITAKIPRSKLGRFRAHPGSHIYLSIPAAARKSMSATSIAHLLFEFLFNPFTVADVDEEDGNVTLVARHCGGPMTAALGRFANAGRRRNTNGANEEKIPLAIEGPYGLASSFPQLCTEFDRILLVAGGVGATFTMPVYRSIIAENPSAKVEFVWAFRNAGDATWTVQGKDAQALMKDENIRLYITGNVADLGGAASSTQRAAGDSRQTGEEEGEELGALYRDRRRGKYTTQRNRQRPNLKKIVDDVFMQGQEERVAVLVCGPKEMAKELRSHVGVWVDRGRSVWYHSEGFGF